MSNEMKDEDEKEECPFGACIGESCRYFCDPCFLWMDEN